MKHWILRLLTTAGALTLAVAASPAQASVMYSFMNITHNNPLDAAIGEAQISLGIDAIGTDQALLTFYNHGTKASSITDLYFDDDAGVMSRILDTNGMGRVDFSVGATPKNLPGGNSLDNPFQATSKSLTADSNAPVSKNGVDPGELLTVAVDLKSGMSFIDLLAALDSSLLRIGLHVQGYASGGSESYINVPNDCFDTVPPPPPQPPVVPEPSSMVLLGLGLAGMGVRGWRRRQGRA